MMKLAGILGSRWLKSVLMLGAAMVFVYLALTRSGSSLQAFASDLGLGGVVFFVLLVASLQIFAPLTSGTLMMLIVKLYGLLVGQAIYYGAGLISGSVNFYLARRYGQAIVTTLAGERVYRKAKDLMVRANDRMLIAARVFGFAMSEVVSYAFGLSRIRYSHFFVLSAVFALVPAVIGYLSFAWADMGNTVYLVAWFAAIAVASGIGGLVFRRMVQ